MSTRDTIVAVIRQVLDDNGLEADLSVDSVYLDGTGLGLTSLDIATIAAELEVVLDADPFAHADVTLGTLGEFIRLYEDELRT